MIQQRAVSKIEERAVVILFLTDLTLDSSYWNRGRFAVVLVDRRQQYVHADRGPSLCLPPLAPSAGIRGGVRGHARARNRRQYCDLHAGRRGYAQEPARG